MRRFGKYAVGAGGMLVLVVAIVLATGSGSAVAAQITSVFVTNDASHAVPVRDENTDANGNVKVHEQGTANVNVGNFPAAPTTAVVSSTGGHVEASGSYTVFDQADLRAYRSVTIYLRFVPAGGDGQACSVVTFDPGGHFYTIDNFTSGNNNFSVHTYDPAPPNLRLNCLDLSNSAFDYNAMLTGRTG